MPGSPKCRLIFGEHRLAAAELLAQTAGRGPVQLRAIIYPAELPDWRCMMIGIAENLAREELSGREKQVQTTLYCGLLKKHGLVADADALRSESEKRTKNDGKPGCQPNASAYIPKPSVTQAVAQELGIDADTVRYRVKKAADLARAAGLEIPEGATPEALPAGMLMDIAKAAATVAHIKNGRNRHLPEESAELFAAMDAEKLLFPFERWEKMAMGSCWSGGQTGSEWVVALVGFGGMGIPPGKGSSLQGAYGMAAGKVLRFLAKQYEKGERFTNSDQLVPYLLELDGRDGRTGVERSAT